MKRAGTMVLVAAGTYIVAAFGMGYGTTALFNHHVYHGWRFGNDPEHARRSARDWNIPTSEVALAHAARGESRLVLSEGWVEYGFARQMTLAYLPYPDWYFINRHSFRLDQSESFRMLHFQAASKHPDVDELRLKDAARGTCHRSGEGFRCSFLFLGRPPGVLHGSLTADAGRTIDDFAINVPWPALGE